MFAINTKIVHGGGQFRPPLYFKCMTKEEIIARKNILRAMGKDIQVDESWGPNLERLWQSVAPGRYMTSSLRVPYEDRSAWYYPSSWLPTRNMSREERQKYLNEHPIVYNMYMDGERYKQGKSLVNGIETLAKTAIAAAGVRGIASGSTLANTVFVPVTGKLVAKKTRDLARGGHKEVLENVADGVETASALYGLGTGGLKAAGKVFNYANKMQKAYDVPQMLFTSAGAMADAMQYPLADNRFDQVENGVENTMNYLGFLGGTNVLRSIPVVGKYADAALDGAAYSQAAYDILKKYNPALRNHIKEWQNKTKFDNKEE